MLQTSQATDQPVPSAALTKHTLLMALLGLIDLVHVEAELLELRADEIGKKTCVTTGAQSGILDVELVKRLLECGRLEAAEEALLATLRFLELTFGSIHYDVAQVLILLASLEEKRGDLFHAEGYLYQAVWVLEQSGRTLCPLTAIALLEFAKLLEKQQEHARSETLETIAHLVQFHCAPVKVRQGRELYGKAAGTHLKNNFLNQMDTLMQNNAFIAALFEIPFQQFIHGQPRRALRLTRRIVLLIRLIKGTESTDAARASLMYGALLYEAGQISKARIRLEHSAKILARLADANDLLLADTYDLLVDVCAAEGNKKASDGYRRLSRRTRKSLALTG